MIDWSMRRAVVADNIRPLGPLPDDWRGPTLAYIDALRMTFCTHVSDDTEVDERVCELNRDTDPVSTLRKLAPWSMPK